MNPNAGGRGVAGSQSMSTAVHKAGAQINFGDLTPYLTYEGESPVFGSDLHQYRTHRQYPEPNA